MTDPPVVCYSTTANNLRTDTESKIPVQLQCVHTGLGAVADIAGFHPREELVGKPISPEVGQLRAGDFQVHIVAPDGILILIQCLLISLLDCSRSGLGFIPVWHCLHDMFPEEGFVIQSGELAGHGVMEVVEVGLEAQVTGIDQVRADLPIPGSHQLLGCVLSNAGGEILHGIVEVFLHRQVVRILLPEEISKILYEGFGVQLGQS